MNLFSTNGEICINGKVYTGRNISVLGNEVYVDGKLQDGLEDKNKIEITIISGVIQKITSDGSIYIKGNVNGNVEAKTNINCDNVFGDVGAGVNINCNDIGGNAMADKINR
ncbi:MULTISPECIES: hypothetical protein [Bacillota]|uniref:hypothetical protein n=1 Tax=Bacillota TaxID=1239 RepID=UPI00092C4DE5|nr:MULTISPECIES: hypothetical protein [Bacillota]NFT30654.1 hypothetical protein [Clostridium sporogenes]OJT57399.1 hypothetical protein BFP47_11885 [Bacillus licheniformis]OJT69959.1 hypothetical protein BFP46_05005 [Bacillus licheniformis]GIN25446.1 hypothetical protein J31TS2_20260 [Bacillus licheniformis]GIN29815.1 hypothetical protein J2TS5_18540 [Bacillus licheniformis]